MSYLSLYRKYRSQSFDQVIGQAAITRTLQNAIRSGRIAHAYLFCGPRGTGKTTTARLLAKALNCAKGPTPEPCNECDACTRIRDGHAMDVVEIDAASNRGIDEIRNLRENVKFVPAEGRYKIYVIDEVHMLTTEAFNALLKTLEEPPDNVVFVLATTEAHKVPATVLSRCQRFDFKRGSLSDLLQRLNTAASSEGVELDPQAASLIAKNAEGSYRDSLSLLEQIIAFSGNKVSLSDAAAVLGAVDSDMLCRVVDDLSSGDAGAAFRLADELLATGRDLRQLLWGLTEHYRNLLVAKLSRGASGLAEVPQEVWPKLQQQADRMSMDQAMEAIEVLSEADKESRWNNQHRLILEVTLLKLIRMHTGVRKAAAPVREEPAQHAPAAQQAPRPTPPATPAPAPQRSPAPAPSAPAPSAPAPTKKAADEQILDAADDEMPPPPDEPPPDPGAAVDPSGIQGRWQEIVQDALSHGRKASGLARRTLTDMVRIGSIEGQTVILNADNAMARDKAEEFKTQLAASLSRILGRQVSCRVGSASQAETLSMFGGAPSQSPHSGGPSRPQPRQEEPQADAPKIPERNIKLRQEALKFFDGNIEGG